MKENVNFDDDKKKFDLHLINLTYLKNEEIIFTEGNSKAINEKTI